MTDLTALFRDTIDDEQRQRIYRALGEAVTSWSRVEGQLCSLFSYFVSGHVGMPAPMAVFGAVINFNTKLAMTAAAAETRLWGSHLAKWKTLQNRTNRQAKKRNELAHFALIATIQIPSGQPDLYLGRGLHEIDRHLSGTQLREKDLIQRATQFRALALDLAQFVVEIGAMRGAQQPERPEPHLATDADQANPA